MCRRFFVKVLSIVAILALLSIILAGSISFAQEKNPPIKTISLLDVSKQNIEIANALIKYIGAIATIFGIILAIAGLFIGFEGIRSRQRREEAIKTLENAKIYVDETVSEYREKMKIKTDEVELLAKETIKLAREQLNRDIEDVSKAFKKRKIR